MEIEFRDLTKPIIKGLPKYFALTPYVMYIESEFDKSLFIGWFNYAIVITKII